MYVPVPQAPTLKYEWRCDPRTGSMYQVQVHAAAMPQPGQHQPQAVQSMGTPLFHQEQQPAWDQRQQLPSDSRSQQVQDHVKGIVSLCEGGATKKSMKVIDFAKKCPAKWAKTAKLDNINLPLYSYGAITELEASLSGRSDPMPEGELLAKLRHLKNVYEVCCLNSTATEFSSYGWVLARDYAFKVENEVEQRFTTWLDMEPGVRTQTLVLTQMENPRPMFKKKNENEVDRKSERKDRCTTFNTCTTEGKCDWEVANPGRICQRKHECSWCQQNLKQSWKHQASKCLKKSSAGQ